MRPFCAVARSIVDSVGGIRPARVFAGQSARWRGPPSFA